MPNEFLSPEGDLEDYFVDEYWLIDQYVGDELWIWGNGAQGRMGINVVADRATPVTTLSGGVNWKQVSCGNQSSYAIKTDGTLWTWGGNGYGQLGDNTTTQRNTPVTTFAGGTNWKQVVSASFHVSALKNDGTLWTWGRNNFGQLGVNNTTQRNTPVTTFAGGNNWKSVASNLAGFMTVAIKTDGTLWTWGDNRVGQLGVNDTTQRNTPVTTFTGGNNWKQVATGYISTVAIKTDGTLWTWGDNGYGQLGINDTVDRFTPVTTFGGGTNWKQVSSRFYSVSAIKTDGTLWVWGLNTSLQLGNGLAGNRLTPITTFAGGTNWKQVSNGNDMTSAVKTDGTLWTWGLGTFGRLGNNNLTTRSTPITTFAGGTNWKQVASGAAHMIAVFLGTTPDLPIS